jgi:NAD(P)-dependent dehydrogenase (short-subunit alcohol dehydrogenase family)
MSAAFRLDGKVVAITGAAGILGAHMTRLLLDSGAQVLAMDRNVAALADLAAAHADRLLLCTTDVSQRASIEAAFAQVTERWSAPDVLLNNAATKSDNFFEPFESFPIEDWNHVMGVNLTGAMQCAQVFGAAMAARGSGVIVNTLSIYGLVGPDQRIYEGSQYMGRAINTPAVYSASKAGLLGLTNYLATYWGHRNVRVNAITPGGVFSGQNDTFVGRYSAKVPLGRMAEPTDIAHAMLYLSSDAAQYVNGHNLVVDGGWTAW